MGFVMLPFAPVPAKTIIAVLLSVGVIVSYVLFLEPELLPPSDAKSVDEIAVNGVIGEANPPSNADSRGPRGHPIQDDKLWLSDGDLPAAFVQHRDWIESCTDLPVLVVSQDLVLYSIDVEDGLEPIAKSLLSKVDPVARQSSSDVGVTMYLPPFANYNEPKDGNPLKVPEALIRTEARILIISGIFGDFGLDYVQRVSENSLVAQIGWGMTHTRVYHVIANKPESVYVTNGDIVDIWDRKNGCFLIVVEEHKEIFLGR